MASVLPSCSSAHAPKDHIYQILEGESYRLIGHSDRRLIRLVTDDLEAFKVRAGHLLVRVEEDAIRTIQRTVNDPYASQQWALDTLNLYGAWDITTGSQSVFVAILDTGVSRSHPDLIQADIREGWDYLASGGGMVWDDPEGHGTAVTGVIAATANNRIGIAGISWKSAIIPFKVLDEEGKGSTSDSTEAIYDAVDTGCKVINISFGCQEAVRSEEDAIQYALDKGVIVVAAAGNDENSEYNYPASYPGVISVAAIDRDKKRAYFSNYNDRVSLTAPGQEIMTLQVGGTYANAHGTSFAAPHVAGIAALALSIQPNLTASDFMTLARVTSRDLGPVGYDREYGYGLIDAQALLASLKSSFPDVPYASWYFGYVANLARRGYINGFGDGTFKPDHQVRRDHAAKMIANAAGLDSQGKKASFPDLEPGHEMSAFIAALVEKGAIRGYPGGYYRPDRPIIREHVCQIVAKAFDLERGDLPVAFNDLSGEAEADSYIEILASNGIVKGRSQDRFSPNSEVTRAELSKILSVAMVVSAIQEAEREVSPSALDRAQALIHALPQDQDLVMREYLQTRLEAVGP